MPPAGGYALGDERRASARMSDTARNRPAPHNLVPRPFPCSASVQRSLLVLVQYGS